MLTNGTGQMCRNVKGGAIEQVRKGRNPLSFYSPNGPLCDLKNKGVL